MVLFRGTPPFPTTFRPILQRDIVCVPGHLGVDLGISRIPWKPVPFIILVFYRKPYLGEFLRYHTSILGQVVHLRMEESLWADS
jgi:hypothetical protein